MYLIVKHSFSTLEHHNPENVEIVGYIKDELDANAWIEAQKDNKKSDGNLYSYYKKTKIEKIVL